MADARIAKLPKWAQQHIAKLERDVEYNKNLAGLGPEGSTIFSRTITERRPIGHGLTIVFRLPDGQEVDVAIRDGKLKVRTDGQAVITPDVSNSFSVTGARRD